MQIAIRKGYSVFRKPGEYMFVAPHCGPAFEVPTSRDAHSETLASLAWMRTGGTFITSSVSRKRAMGIDFNRGMPPKRLSMSLFEKFVADEDSKILHDYRQKYAWSSINERDYELRKGIYNSFWEEVRKGRFIALVHSCSTRLKNVPTLMDVTTFGGKGVDKGLLKDIVEEVNYKHKNFWKKIEKEYKAVVLLEQERIIENIIRVYNVFNLREIDTDFMENLKGDYAVLKKHAPKRALQAIKEDFSPHNFLKAAKQALLNMDPPCITVEHIFSDKKSIGPKKKLFPNNKRCVINFESTTFINSWYPGRAAEAIVDILDRVKEEYT